MYVCMYVCICMYVFIYVCTCMYVYVRMYVCIYVCMCVCMYVYMYVCTCMYVCIYIHVCMYGRMYVCMYGWMDGCLGGFSKTCLLKLDKKGLTLSQKHLTSNRRNVGFPAPKSMRFPLRQVSSYVYMYI